MSKIATLIINFVLIAIIGVALIIGNVILFNHENEVSSLLNPPIVDQEAVELSSSTGQEMAKRIMEEGAVLLRNENNTLPLDYGNDKQVNVFGWRSIDWVYGSEGQNASGGVAPEDDDFEKNVDIYKALNLYGIQYNTRLHDMYYRYKTPDHQSANLKGTHISTLTPLKEPNINNKNYYTEDLLQYSKDFSDVAIVVISRMAGEGMDASTTSQAKAGDGAVNDNTRHYLEISTEEEGLLTWVGQNFQKVIVLLNIANPFECGFLDTIPGLDACMYIGFTGTRAAAVIPKLLYGDVSPSGKTVDTFPYDLFTNPGSVFLRKNYSDYSKSFVDMVENVYVGYKWYETADVMGVWDDVNNAFGEGYEGVVQFPFGFGLSYNQYEWSVKEFSVQPGSNIDQNTKINISVGVKNLGNYPGRDVVEAYVTVPYYDNQIEKSYLSLVAFNKTNLLQPGTEEIITLEIDAYDFMSYDCYDKNNNNFKGYELEQGIYTVKLMTDSHTIKTVNYNNSQVPATFDYNVPTTIKMQNDPITGSKVENLFTGDDAVDLVPIDANDGDFAADIPWFSRKNFPKPSEWASLNVARECTPTAKVDANWNADKVNAWDNASTDVFGDSVDAGSVTWGANNGKRLTDTGGALSELALRLGADFDSPEWEDVLDQITVSEAVNIINNYYGTKAIASIGKPELKDYDGPAQIKGFAAAPRGTGYPTMVVVAQTWNPNLAYEFGKAFGDDMKALGISGVWGWAIDSHRSPFFGRNHESPSEDPLLAGTIISKAVKGLNTRGRYSIIKHYALYTIAGNHTWLTEQALREVYLKPFRKAFVEGEALGCMTTYTPVGAEFSETTVGLIGGVLRREWNFKGAITTDYIATNSRIDALLRCGGNLGMGVRLSIGDYNQNSSLRLQNRLREATKETIYMWLRACYNEQQYLLNPDANETFIVSNTINSWSWWQPTIYTIDVTIGVGLAMWSALVLINAFMPPMKKKISEVEI